ncbi:MAG: hypothetical protein HC804_03750 [Anaerolineae bacterium]|nr:hypothetical protein [Anaerolineae bacterium]
MLLLILAAAAYLISQNRGATVTAVPTSNNMAHIPTALYTVGLGSGSGNTAAEQQVNLSEYWLDRHETTNAEYASYLAASAAERSGPRVAIRLALLSARQDQEAILQTPKPSRSGASEEPSARKP